MPEKQSFQEQRVRKISLSYYSRKDVLDAIFKFSAHREVSPRYFEGFGKRPDSFQYLSDIISLVKRGATSLHCSEEIWEEPLDLSTELGEEELNELRTGWDLVIDIDCKWIDYSKKAAEAIIRALKYRGVENIGIKFSGGKGFHIIVPWEAFPEEVGGIKTKDMFPYWPRAIVGHITELAQPILADLIKDTEADFKKVEGFTGIKCKNCGNLSDEVYEISLRCEACKVPYIETFRTSNLDYEKKKCPACKSELKEVDKTKFYNCNRCEINSLENPSNFNEKMVSTDIFQILGLDLLLVSSRHLFRMPYSLHEKTALASIVLDKNKIREFDIKDANPLNVKVLDFMPKVEKDEAKELLIQAIDWQKSKELEKEKVKFGSSPDGEGEYSGKGGYSGKKKKFEPIRIADLKDEYFPPTILKILKGMNDGRKRGLFILLNFFRSLGQTIEEVEERVNKWNELNTPKLKQGYINSQLVWHSKNKVVMPPNFDNEIYKAIGVLDLDHMSKKVKNPVSYVIRKSGAWKQQKK